MYLLACALGFFIFSILAVFMAACVAGSIADDQAEEIYYKMLEEHKNG